MPTINELAKRYARRILNAIERDGFSKYKKVTASSLASSATINELKAIKQEIDGLYYSETKKPISEADKLQLITEIQRELHLPSRKQMEMIFESASNDDLSDLADEIENILKGQ